jgi:hypothetical protein
VLKPASFLVLALVAAGCGSSSDATTAPSIAQVAGVWRGTTRVLTVTGGECFAASLQVFVGSTRTASAAMTQTGSTLNVTITDPDRGYSCAYTGTTGASTIQLTATSCGGFDSTGAPCATGALRDLRLQTSRIDATVSGTSMTGTEVDTLSVNVSGTTTPVGTLTMTSDFAVTKQ